MQDLVDAARATVDALGPRRHNLAIAMRHELDTLHPLSISMRLVWGAEELPVVYCVTSFKRTFQVCQALPVNLAVSWKWRGQIVWVLVDFNVDDNELEDFVNDKCRLAVDCGLLRYFRCNRLLTWHASCAKNTAHLAGADLFEAEHDMFRVLL